MRRIVGAAAGFDRGQSHGRCARAYIRSEVGADLGVERRLNICLKGVAMDYNPLLPITRSGPLGFNGGGDPFASLRREMDRMFQDFGREWPQAAPSGTSGVLSPKVNVAETEKGIEITADMPGVDPKDIALDLADGVLTLRAERTEEKEEKDEKKQYHLIERVYGTFLRRFALPFETDDDKIEASFDKGVLKVFVPKSAAAAKQAKKIEVKAG
jgi:HSP20 family protein